ncbi:hypothetical protein ACHAWF_002958 [Thalassiosira exigua]
MTDAVAIEINDLPDALFANIAKFLACPSQAAFAVAMEGIPGPRNAVLASRRDWSTLDFGEIETGMASKLSDDDVGRMLTAIDAIHNLKTLKLSGCAAVTGSGLAPLAGSTALEMIDLVVGRVHSLSPDLFVPIISSVVDAWVGLRPQTPRESWAIRPGERCLDLPESFYESSPHSTEPGLDFDDESDDFAISGPKHNRSSFFLYSLAVRDGVNAAYPEDSFEDIAPITARKFEALSAQEVAYWDRKEAEDKERYMIEMDQYRERLLAKMPSSVNGGSLSVMESFLKRYASILTEAPDPTRNNSCFFFYSNAVCRTVMAANPEARFIEIHNVIVTQFNGLTREERAYWDQIAQEDRVRYMVEMKEYRGRKRLKLTSGGWASNYSILRGSG